MSTALNKLLVISSEPLNLDRPVFGSEFFREISPLGEALLALLKQKNGFFAFESALHVFPARSSTQSVGLVEWNAEELWTGLYAGAAAGCLFFAEDIFGCQFCIREDEVQLFEPETGEWSFFATDLENWAERILDDYEFVTGYPLARKWQASNGVLAVGQRLVPKIPFVMGGEYQLDNLYSLDAVKAMQLRAEIARQIRGLPDGTHIRFKVMD